MLEDLVRAEMRAKFKNDKCNWFPRTDTVEHAKYDKRTPAFFKVEWDGEMDIISLGMIRHITVLGIGKINFVVKGKIKECNVINKDEYLDVIYRGFKVSDNRLCS